MMSRSLIRRFGVVIVATAVGAIGGLLLARGPARRRTVSTDLGTNLVVFPDRLSLNSANWIEVHSSKNLLSQRLP
jgi:hypothetical protein